jgi:flagellar motor protein MotB
MHLPPHKKVETEKDQSERWLLTYSDMITLLLGLFIVMYSISNVDSIKLQTVASSIRGGFGLDEKGQELGANNKSETSWTRQMIKKVCVKVNVDRIGEIKPA